MDVFIVLEPDEAMPPAENIIGVFASLEAALYFAAGNVEFSYDEESRPRTEYHSQLY
jgi:hypothetical protein